MSFWFPMTPQHLQMPAQAPFQGAVPPAMAQMPFCLGPMPHMPLHMMPAVPMPMQYSNMHEVWVPMHCPAGAPYGRSPVNLSPDGPTDAYTQPDHSMAMQWHHQATAGDSQRFVPQQHGRQPSRCGEQHIHTHSHSLQGKPSDAASIAAPSTPCQAHRSRKPLDHLARSWSPASAATSSNRSTAASNSSAVLPSTASQQPPSSRQDPVTHCQSHMEACAVDSQSAADQLSRLQLTCDAAAAVASRHSTAGEAERVEDGLEHAGGCETLDSAWQGLTEGLLKDVLGLLPPHCNKRCRLVCKRWRDTLDSSLQVYLSLSAELLASHLPLLYLLPFGSCHDLHSFTHSCNCMSAYSGPRPSSAC